MIELSDLSYRYPRASTSALAGVSWRLEDGAFSVVAGPSGGGKSTLLRCLNGLVPHLSGGRFTGAVHVAGHDAVRYGPRVMSRIAGFVFQDPDAQAVAATVEDEIAFTLEQLGVARPIMRMRVEEMLDLLGIAQLRRRSLTTLSGGERQRVAIAAAMATHPRLLALDEPMSQLDPWGADEVVAALDRLNADLGVTIVIAEHRLDRLLPRADRLIWIDDGRIAADGDITTVLSQVDTVFLPPLTSLARSLSLVPLPKTVKEMKARLAGWAPGWSPQSETVASGEVVVRLHGVSVRRDGRTVLRDVELTAGAGDLIAIMGRNGSGKTTLLRTIFGFECPERGEIQTAGLDMRRHDPAELGRRAAYLPQRSSSMLFNETVRAELDFTRRHRAGDADDGWLIDALELGELLDRDPRDLSEGERLRAALAASLVGAPKVVLLDEPTRGMDGRQRARLQNVLAQLRRRGACVLLATHDVELAAQVASRVALLGDGEIVADGSPREFLAGSLTYSTGIDRLLGGGFLTLNDIDPDSLRTIDDTFGRGVERLRNAGEESSDVIRPAQGLLAGRSDRG